MGVRSGVIRASRLPTTRVFQAETAARKALRKPVAPPSPIAPWEGNDTGPP